MDAKGFDEMITETIEWMEHVVPDLLKTLAEDADEDEPIPNLDGVVLDGDSSTDKVLIEHLEARAEELSATDFCQNMTNIPCTNHAAKNCGKHAYEQGHRLHLTCSCPVKKKKPMTGEEEGED